MKILPVETELLHAEGRTERRTDRRDGVNICFSKYRECAQTKTEQISSNTGVLISP